jgi:F420-0:gamma-glutamyl ligase
MRRGLVGISIAYFGFKPLYDYRGTTDLFGRELKVSLANIPDSLAAGAVFNMGEGPEQTPVVLISDLPKSIKFINTIYKPTRKFSTFEVPMEEDLFKPFLTSVPWKKPNSSK